MEVPSGADVPFQATGTTLLHYATARQAVAAAMGGVSALSVISLRRNGISTTSAIPTARLPAPSSLKSLAYPALVATIVVPVGSGIIPEKSPANSDAGRYRLRDLLRSAIGVDHPLPSCLNSQARLLKAFFDAACPRQRSVFIPITSSQSINSASAVMPIIAM